jgi:hypothetical protein
MNSVFFDSAMPEELRRERLYEGQIGTTMGDYLRGTDLSHLPPNVVDRYEREPAAARRHQVGRRPGRKGMATIGRKGEWLP